MTNLGYSVNNVDNQIFLDMSNVPEYTVIERVAYVHDVILKTSKYDSGFATFILKDINANTVAARLFNLEDFMLAGYKAAAFKHQPVKFKCTVQEFNGALSIVIDGKEGISVWDGEFDYDKFVGHVQYDLKDFKSSFSEFEYDGVLTFADEVVPSEWESSSFDRLANGKTGSFNKLVEIAWGCIKPMLSEENKKELMAVTYVTFSNYFRYLKSNSKLEVIGTLGAYDVLSYVNSKYSNDDNRLIYLDALRAVIGVEKPLHVYAHYVKNAIEFAKSAIMLETKYTSMPLGTKAYVGGVELSKY